MHFQQNVHSRPFLNAAQAMSINQQNSFTAQQQQAASAAIHKAQQAQHQGLPLQHRIRPPHVGSVGNIPSVRVPMNSNPIFNPDIKNLLQTNTAAATANGNVGINMNNVKNINQLGLNFMQAQRLSVNGANGQIPYSNIQLQGMFFNYLYLIS